MKELTKAKLEVTLYRFDFSKVRNKMLRMDWGWEKSEGVPSIEEIEEEAEKRLESAYDVAMKDDKTTYGFSSSGGLTAFYMKQHDVFFLFFDIEMSDSYIEKDEDDECVMESEDIQQHDNSIDDLEVEGS